MRNEVVVNKVVDFSVVKLVKVNCVNVMLEKPVRIKTAFIICELAKKN